MKKILILLSLLVFVISCSVDYNAEVKSNTTWSGAFGNRTVDGNGNSTVDLSGEHPVCCCVQKQTSSGYLRVRVTASGGFLGGIFGPGNSSWVETTAAYGVVTVCSEG